MADRRERSLPPARAASLVARTLHRQLRRAGYDRAELLAVVNEMLDRIVASDDDEPLSGVSDVETPVSNAEALLDVLEVELRRARDIGAPLLVVMLDLEAPDWCADEAVFRLHATAASMLRRGVRPNDTVGRLSTTRYAIVLPGATPDVAGAIVARLVRPLVSPRRSDESPPEGMALTWRAAAPDVDEGGAALLARCARGPGHLVEPETRASRMPPPLVERERSSAPVEAVDTRAVILALGGGAARAAAHIGVLRAFERAGVPIAGIAGTSAGALVGAMYLAGMSPDAILDRFVTFTRSSVYSRMRRAWVAYRRSADIGRRTSVLFRQTGVPLLSSSAMAAVDDEIFSAFVDFFLGPDREIAELRAPFATAATDLVAGRPVWMTRGPLHFAVRASCALPGLFAPQRDGDRVLVDGSVLSEVPIAAAHALSLKAPVVAVHLARPDRDVTKLDSAAEVIVRSSAMTHKELVREQLADASMLLTARVEEIGWLDFRKAVETAALGETAAETFLRGRRLGETAVRRP